MRGIAAIELEGIFVDSGAGDPIAVGALVQGDRAPGYPVSPNSPRPALHVDPIQPGERHLPRADVVAAAQVRRAAPRLDRGRVTFRSELFPSVALDQVGDGSARRGGLVDIGLDVACQVVL